MSKLANVIAHLDSRSDFAVHRLIPQLNPARPPIASSLFPPRPRAYEPHRSPVCRSRRTDALHPRLSARMSLHQRRPLHAPRSSNQTLPTFGSPSLELREGQPRIAQHCWEGRPRSSRVLQTADLAPVILPLVAYPERLVGSRTHQARRPISLARQGTVASGLGKRHGRMGADHPGSGVKSRQSGVVSGRP